MALTRTSQQEENLTVQINFDEAFLLLKNAYEKVGKIQSVQDGIGRITGRIGSGYLNMNGADVTINVKKIDNLTCEFRIIATAQEGLISQNTCGKAISRILDAVSLCLGQKEIRKIIK